MRGCIECFAVEIGIILVEAEDLIQPKDSEPESERLLQQFAGAPWAYSRFILSDCVQ